MSSNRPASADVHPGPGFRICTTYPGVDPALITRMAQFDVPDISDRLNRLYALDSGISHLNKEPIAIAGTVCTVRVFPGDNLMVHRVLDICRPGDIVVIDGQGVRSMNAVLGDIICTKAKHRGIVGFVVDGLVRDMPGIDEIGMPIYGRGTTAVGPFHRGPGEVNYPVACGGVVVNPGDLLVANGAGIVSIPNNSILQVIEDLEARSEAQAKYLDAVQTGNFSNDWVDGVLTRTNCPVFDKPTP